MNENQEVATKEVVADTEKSKQVRGRVKIKKRTVTLEQIGNQIGQDFVAAIYSSIGNRSIDYLDSGDELSSVTDQYLDGHGMREDLIRLSSTRIEVHIGLDVSGSMYGRAHLGGSLSKRPPIVMATTVLRLFNQAFETIARDLPANVFTYHIWLWANESHCLTDPNYGTADEEYNYTTNTRRKTGLLKHRCQEQFGTDIISDVLKQVSERRKSAWWCGSSGTSLKSFLSEAMRWEQENSNPSAHRLFVAITDGAIGDYAECSKLASLRSGRCENLLLDISSSTIGRVPDGFTGYDVNIFNLESYIREFLMGFVQRLA